MFGNWVKKYWIVLVVVVLCPIIVNFVLQIPAFSSIVGNNIDWLSFWGDYLSAIVSSGVALYILYKQYTQNQGENKCLPLLHSHYALASAEFASCLFHS